MKKILFLALGATMVVTANAQIAYDNGSFNTVNGIRPSANWDPLGIVNDFTLAAGNSTFTSIHLEMIDGTTPIGQISSVQSVRIRMFNLIGRTVSSLGDADIPNTVYDQTFTKGAGTFVDTLSGTTAFSRDVEFWDLAGPSTNLGAGHWGIWLTMPGSGAIDSFWGTSTPVVAGDPDAVFGPGINSGNVAGNNEHAFRLTNTVVPEPASMAVLGIGALALIRRRRSKKA